jgi:hypothetical protein
MEPMVTAAINPTAYTRIKGKGRPGLVVIPRGKDIGRTRLG